jgi:hypothetical protein
VPQGKALVLSGPDGPNGAGKDKEVVVKVLTQGNVLEQTARCRWARIETRYLAALKKTTVSALLTDVEITRATLRPNEPSALPIRKADWPIGSLRMPEGIEQRLGDVDLEVLWRHQERFPAVRQEMADLKRYIVGILNPKVLAEMHGRVAYGVGCFLLVAVGAALGMIFRGGNILSAFALSCIPAMVLIILMVMGKQMVSNPDVPTGWGLAAVWSGVGILAAMTAYLYGLVLRR